MQTPYAPPVADYDKPHTQLPATALFAAAKVLAKGRAWLSIIALCLGVSAMTVVVRLAFASQSGHLAHGIGLFVALAAGFLALVFYITLAVLVLRLRRQISVTVKLPSEQNFLYSIERFGLFWKTIGTLMLLFASVVGLLFGLSLVLRVFVS